MLETLDIPIARPVQYMKLNVACGSLKEDGWIGIDIAPLPTVDIVHDLLSFPWPIPDNSVSELLCSHYLEHIPHLCMCCHNDPDPLLATFDEFYRILIPGGTARVVSPHESSVRAWRDPTHRRAINEDTFLYTALSEREKFGVGHYPVKCNFVVSWGFSFDPHGQIQDVHAELVKG